MTNPVLPQTYVPSPELLKDRIILITGATDGLGRAAALSCAQHQATVILLGKTVRKLEQVYDDIVAMGAPQPAIYPLNLESAQQDDYLKLAHIIDQEFGRLDGLLLNAAWLGTLTPIVHYDPAVWSRVMQINLNANYLLCRECFPVLRKSADARVLFTTDDVAAQATPYYGAYAISKAGSDTLMRILAQEWDNSSIGVNSIDPGITQTNLRRQAFPGEDARQLPTPQSRMSGYLYLLGPDSRGIRGQRFQLDQSVI